MLLSVLIISSCGNSTNTGNDFLKTSNLNNKDADMETGAPKFIDVQTAREELKSAMWGSQGWRIYFPNQSTYIYAGFGRYLLRYNISDNKIDRAVKSGDTLSSFYDINWSFTLDGKYAIFADLWNENYQYQPRNIYLLNFENREIRFLAYSESDFKIENIPENIRVGFNIENIFLDGNHDNLDVLNCTIEHNFEEDKYIAYTRGNNSSGYEVTALRGASLNCERPFVGIDAKRVGSIVPINGNGLNLGYYKFVLIDIEKNKIVQECPINIK